MTLETGIRGEQSVLVTAANTAKTMGSGTLDVFATPALVALAEKTCWMSVADALGEGNGSVGTKLELEHTAPTPVGMTVTCESELVAVEGRKLTFKVALHDEKGPVGGGTHERFVINNAKFAAKAEAKKSATRYSTSSSRPLEKDSSFMAVGNRSTRAISRAVAASGLMAMDSPSSLRINRSWRPYSGLRIRAMVCCTPIFFATRHVRILISSLEVVAISRSACSTSASFCTS